MQMGTVELPQEEVQVEAVELEVPELPLRNLRVPQEEMQVKMQVSQLPLRSKIRVLVSIQKS
jgi:hypothetical protein